MNFKVFLNQIFSKNICGKNIVNVAQSTANTQETRIASSSTQNTASRDIRAASTYSRAGSMARSSVARAGSMARAGSTFRY